MLLYKIEFQNYLFFLILNQLLKMTLKTYNTRNHNFNYDSKITSDSYFIEKD